MASEPLRVLLIRPWVMSDADVRDALRAGAFEPSLDRVDFEAALAAALPRAPLEVVILDPRSGLGRATVEQLMRDLGVWAPLLELDAAGTAPPDLAHQIRAARARLRN